MGSGQQLQRAMSRSLSGQTATMAGSLGREEAGRVAAQLPGMRPDPFRTIVPPSAFRMEERGSAGMLLLLCAVYTFGRPCMHPYRHTSASLPSAQQCMLVGMSWLHSVLIHLRAILSRHKALRQLHNSGVALSKVLEPVLIGLQTMVSLGGLPSSSDWLAEHNPRASKQGADQKSGNSAVCGAGGQDAPPTPGRRHGQPNQQLPAMPELQTMLDMGQWPTGQPVGWPLGPRAQHPYPATSVSSVGTVVQAFRGMNMHVSHHLIPCHCIAFLPRV